MAGYLGNGACVQVGVVCADIQKTSEHWKRVLGTDNYVQIDSAPYEVSKTTFHGKDTSTICKQGFFMLGEHFQLELIQPDDNPSAWREHLDEHVVNVNENLSQVLSNI